MQAQTRDPGQGSESADQNKINGDRDSNKVGGKCRPAVGVTMAQIQQWYQRDRAKIGNDPRYRYVYIPLQMLRNEVDANFARIGLFKALNMTAVNADDIYVGEDVSDRHGVLYRILVSKLWPRLATDAWSLIANPLGGGTKQPRRPFSPAPAIAAKKFDANQPAPADQVAYNAVYGNVYNELIDFPAQESTLRNRLGVQSEPQAFGAVKEAINFGPRIFYLLRGRGGLQYWVTVDEFNNNEGAPIPYSPNETPRFTRSPKLSIFGTQAHEIWFWLKNGLIAFGIFGNAEQERSKAEQIFVVDPNNKRTRDLINGRSCITCHMQGAQAANSDLVGGNWTPNDRLAEYYDETRSRFQEALRKIAVVSCNAPTSWIDEVVTGSMKREPVNVLIQRVEGTGDGTLDMIVDEDSLRQNAGTALHRSL